MGLRRSRWRPFSLHSPDLRHPVLQELLGIRLGLAPLHSLDSTLRHLWQDLHSCQADTEAGWTDSDEACRVGGSDEYAVVADHGDLFDHHFLPLKELEDDAYGSWKGLGDEWADCDGDEDAD